MGHLVVAFLAVIAKLNPDNAAGRLTLEKWAGFWRYVRDQCEFSFPVSYEWFLRRENFAAVADGHYNKDRRVA